MSRQDKATIERNARTLRELVKQPDNKNCADCRKNDARWASWNLGVFLCIRCSGIHRSMGTHISKVKSIDLDMWTPEQMESVQKWGNKRANLYWEKHLKAGHIPPDHKIESFIRSKYESKRWAMDGPPPSDPSVLENGGGGGSRAPPADHSQPTATSTAPPAAPGATARHPLLSRPQVSKPPAPTPAPAPAAAPLFDLFADDPPVPPPTTTAPPTLQSKPAAPAPAPTTGAAPPGPTAAATTAAGPATTAPSSNIFDLDFRAPTPSNKPQTAKADIMSLFSSTSPNTAPATQTSNSFFNTTAPPATASPYATWGGGITSSNPPTQQHPTQTALPTNSWGGLQMDQNAWGAPVQAQPQPQAQTTQSQSQSNSNIWASSDPWSSTGNTSLSNGLGAMSLGGSAAVKKEDKDPFANIWQ